MTDEHGTPPRTLRKPYSLRFAVIAGIAAVGCCALQVPAVATAVSASARNAAQTGPVSSTPATGTPKLAATGTTETVRQLVQCGGNMYAVGSFTEIQRFTTTYPRNNIFSFSATPGFKVTSWAPNVNGEINSIAFSGSNCNDAYIGGQFTSVNGTKVNNFAEIDTTTGNVVPGFDDHVGGGHVDTLLVVNGHLLVGGTFTTIGGTTTNPYYASVSPATGKDDGFLHLGISGHYQFPKVKANGTEVYNQQLSHSGRLLLVEGDFTSVGGLSRQQIFMLNVNRTPPKVTGWSSPEFDGSKGTLIPSGYPYQCGDSHPFYIHAAAWSPDDSTIYIADTGVHTVELERPVPDARAVRRGGGLPGHREGGAARLDRQRRLRLAVLGGRRQQRGLRRQGTTGGSPTGTPATPWARARYRLLAWPGWPPDRPADR